jgi:hypothetical protein
MPLVHECAAEDCTTLTLGRLCLACEEADAEDRQHPDVTSVADLGLAEVASVLAPSSLEHGLGLR